MVPHLGCKSVFYVGSLVPLAALPVFVWVVPESVRFLAVRGDHERVAKILAAYALQRHLERQARAGLHEQRSSVARLFTGGRAMGTALLWTALFLSLLLTVFM